MKKQVITLLATAVVSCFFLNDISLSQNIAVNTSGAAAAASALLDIGNGTAAAGGDTKGLLIPRVALTSSTDATTILSPATSLIVYCSGTGGLSPSGYYYWDGTTWIQLGGGSGGSNWLLAGNTLTGGTSATPNEFLGSTNNYDWILKTNNTEKVRVTAAGYLGIGTSISTPSQLLHLASTGVSTVERFETQNVTTSLGTTTNYTTSPTFTTAGADVAGIGTVTWTNPGNITASDAAYATAVLASTTTHYLQATNFGFAIPATATILGIKVEWQKKVGATSGASSLDNAIRIVKAGVIGTTDYKSATPWSTTEGWSTYGTGTTDMWGLAWTPADINATNFGAALSVTNGATSRTFSVNACRITVYYSMPPVPVVGNLDWSIGTDYSDLGKFKISKAATLTSTNYMTIDGSGDVGIGTTSPNASAQLDVTSTTKGLLMPRVALTITTSSSPVTSPATSLLVYNTATVNDVTPGYYMWNGIKWVTFGGSGWLTVGNASTVDGTNFLGTTDDIPFNIKVNNQRAGRIDNATGGTKNVALGYQALNNAVGNQGTNCVAVGYQALMLNIQGGLGQGANNTAVGYQALMNSTNAASFGGDGNSNVAVGYQAMLTNDIGYDNVAVGAGALKSNTGSQYLTAVGFAALANSTGASNTAIGWIASELNTSGSGNTSLGASALHNATTANYNTAVGANAMSSTTAGNNVALGAFALNYFNTSCGCGGGGLSSGTGNTAVGPPYYIASCGLGPSYCGVGYTNTTGSNNTFLGMGSNTNAAASTNRTAIGAYSYVSADNCLVLGSINGTNNATANTNVGIGCSAPTQALYVVGNIYATGSVLGAQAACSDVRWKKDFAKLDNSLDKILQLSGYYYTFRTDEFPEKKFSSGRQLGMKAQEVEKLFPEIIFTDKEGFKYLDYSRLAPILVEAIKEQQKNMDDMKAEYEGRISKLESSMRILTQTAKAEK